MYRLASEGFKSYTGIFGGVQFENGETNQELTLRQVNNIGGIVVLEKVLENGDYFQVGPHSTDPVSIDYVRHLAEENNIAYQATLAVNEDKPVDEKISPAIIAPLIGETNLLFSREQLEEIADKSGISGLRELSDGYGIKARSVAEIINALLEIAV
jgi:hypothetical protein